MLCRAHKQVAWEEILMAERLWKSIQGIEKGVALVLEADQLRDHRRREHLPHHGVIGHCREQCDHRLRARGPSPQPAMAEPGVLSRKPVITCHGWKLCDTLGMKTTAALSYKRHRYPAEIIAHTVWLYFRFSLSFRDVEELMAARGVTLSYETCGGGH